MSGEGVPHEHLRSRVGVQEALVRRLEEALVRVEARLQQLVQKLPEDAAAVDAGFVQAVRIEQVDADALLQVRLWGGAGKNSRGTLMPVLHSDPRALNGRKALCIHRRAGAADGEMRKLSHQLIPGAMQTKMPREEGGELGHEDNMGTDYYQEGKKVNE